MRQYLGVLLGVYPDELNSGVLYVRCAGLRTIYGVYDSFVWIKEGDGPIYLTE